VSRDAESPTETADQPDRAGFRGNFQRLAKSFRCAGAGVLFLVKTQPNARIHFAATILSVGTGVYFQIDRL
jgi:diacylglycerol kinase